MSADGALSCIVVFNIDTFQDALDRITDFVSEQMDELQNLISEIENTMDETPDNNLPNEQIEGEL